MLSTPLSPPLSIPAAPRSKPGSAPPPTGRDALSFGTYRVRGPLAERLVRAALEAGVRRIDTAQLYRNEDAVFAAVRAFEAAHPGESIHVTSKLYDNLTFEQALARVSESAQRLGRPLDRMLLHRPLPAIMWRALSASVDEGLTRSIGVSNHSAARLEQVLALCNGAALSSGATPCHRPALNQVELHPFVGPVHSMLSVCRARGVRVQGHTMLARGELFDFAPLARMAARHGRSPAVIMLRWAHQLGVEVLFHASREEHLAEVLGEVFTMEPGLSLADMAQINGFHCTQTRRFFSPTQISESHPELSAITDTATYVETVARLLAADLSALADGAPVSRTALCLHTRTNRELLRDPVAQRIALALFPVPAGKAPMSSHQRYRDAVRALRAALSEVDQHTPRSGRASCSLPTNHAAAKPLPWVHGEPVLAPIAEPTPMPVEVAPFDELEPFLRFVADPSRLFGAGVGEGAPVTFPRGTFFGDQRMDLCKQVVGPDHIEALCEAVASQAGRPPSSGGYRVRHFLLGNNVACQGESTAGAEAMAKLMGDARVGIETWYLAGNCVGPADARVLAQALHDNTSARALWLKRNPIGADGARHLGRMLAHNRTLELLDLHNTGLFDEGVEALVPVAERAAAPTWNLRHLYLSANALTERSVHALARSHTPGALSSLRSLYLSINRLRDAGLEAMVSWIGTGALAGLRSLDLGSNGFSAPDLAPLVDALLEHCPELRSLDLGTYKSTRDLGERPNTLDPDVSALVRLLRSHPSLELLDVSICGLPDASLDRLVDALGPSQSLEGVGARALRHSSQQRRLLKHAPRVVHIDSVYRGRA